MQIINSHEAANHEEGDISSSTVIVAWNELIDWTIYLHSPIYLTPTYVHFFFFLVYLYDGGTFSLMLCYVLFTHK